MPDTLGWGILGTGNIARQFCAGVETAGRSRLAAVGSRTLESAGAFAQTHHIPAGHGNYGDLLNDPDVDAVYISLPNSMHHEWTVKALRAGKHVLCEKPFASNLTEATEMFAEAHKAKRLLVEGFMYRAHPLTQMVLRSIRSGEIGQVKLIRASFCYRTQRIDGNIRFDPALAGGALMDIGCYCTDFARLIVGQDPMDAQVSGVLHPKGVDELAAGVLRFPNEIVATFTCGMTVQADNTAYVCGSEGWIEIPVPWKPPMKDATYTVARGMPPRMDGGKPATAQPRQTHSISAHMDLYGIEADAFAASVLEGQPLFISEAETLCNMRLLDQFRRQLGVKF